MYTYIIYCVYVRPAYNTALYLGRGVDVTAGRSASACTSDHACVVRRRRPAKTSCALARRASTARDASAAHARRFFFCFLSSFRSMHKSIITETVPSQNVRRRRLFLFLRGGGGSNLEIYRSASYSL